MTEEATPAKVRLTDGLGPLPATGYVLAREGDGHSDLRLMSEPAYTEEQMRAYAAEQVAAERERWRALLEARAAGCERAAENTEDSKFDAMARVLMSVREDGARPNVAGKAHGAAKP